MTRLKLLAVVVASSGIVAAGAARGLARPSSPEAQAPAQEPSKPAEPKPVAAAHPPAEPAGVEPIDEIELAKVDLQLHTEQADALKGRIVNELRKISQQQDWIEKVRAAGSLQILHQYGVLNSAEENLTAAKARVEAEFASPLESMKKSLMQTRQSYLETMKQVRGAERRIKELEARLAPANPPIAPAPGSGGEGASLDDRIDRWKLENIQAELLRMEVERSRERMKSSDRELDELREQVPRLARPNTMTEDEQNRLAARLSDDLGAAGKRGRDARVSFENESRQLVMKERELRELAKGLPATVQADLAHASAGARTTNAVGPAESDRRLDLLERKLDRVLEALERKGKE